MMPYRGWWRWFFVFFLFVRRREEASCSPGSHASENSKLGEGGGTESGRQRKED